MDEQKRYRAYICCGATCTLRHSSALLDVLQREVDQSGLSDDVEVMPGGCMKHCEAGPSMVVWPGRVYYEKVDANRLRRIVREHLAQDRPVRELFYVEPPGSESERAQRRLEAQRALEARLGQQQRNQPPDRGPVKPPTPLRPEPPRRREHRPSWRQSDGDVDDFKW